jgi:hypothetical protein
MVQWGIEFPILPWRPIVEKSSHLREKGGVLVLFKTTLHLGAKAQYQARAIGDPRRRHRNLPGTNPVLKYVLNNLVCYI